MARLIKQVSTVLNDAIKATLGKNAPTVIDTNNFVSCGQQIDKMNLYEDFYKQLVNRVVQTVYFIRTYTGKTRNIWRDEHEYGAFIQKVYYTMPDAVDNPAFEVAQGVDGDLITGYKQQSPYDIETTVPVRALVYGGQGTWSIEIIRPINQIKSAFVSASAMEAFIDGIYTAVSNRYEVDVENLISAAANTLTASCLAYKRGRNLLDEYNKAHADGILTVAQALENVDFLKFATREIKNTVEFMQKMSTIFNNVGYETFTPRDSLVVEVLTHFASATDSYLQSDTFHNELTALPRYEEIPYWQGSGTGYSFADCSTINIKNDGLKNDKNEQSDTVNQSGIIAVLRDVEACAAYFSDRETWEMLNPRSRVMIHGEQANKGFAVDNFANCMVFYLAESEAV